MIKKYRFGTPVETDAVVEKKPETKGKIGLLEELPDGETIRFGCTLEKEDVVYGLGENVRGINKRGWIYESRCMDDPVHVETRRSLYAAHNFLIVAGRKTFGVFVDHPGLVTFDIGYTHLDRLEICPQYPDLDLYIIEGSSLPEIVREFRRMIGMSYLAPKWAFGYQQSRWSYMDEEEIRGVVEGHRKNHIPLDAVYLDIDYMERYKDFTVNQETFPDLAGFTARMREQGIHLVPIIDAGVKIEDGYSVYEEGREKGYFCKNEDGTDFIGGVWPGRVHFPDFLNEKTREWFGGCYRVLMDQGIDGFWNDMNEPALFYSQANLEEVFRKVGEYQGKKLELSVYREFLGMISALPNNRDDYKRIFHTINGKKVRHDRVHNLYGYNMTRAAGEAFERLSPEKRILMFSRSSYVGMHRYGGIWMGDNQSWWSHLLMNFKMLPSLNMVGILYTGSDIGGFGADATEDLCLRWTEAALFNPLMRNHSAFGTRRQEAYTFDHPEAFRNIIALRYSLIPYIYSEFMKAALTGGMMFSPLAFAYPEDPFAAKVEDQLLVGESLMAAPVYTQNADGRYVYLPEPMLLIRAKSPSDYECLPMEAGHHFVNAALDEVIFFLRPGRILPLAAPAERTDRLDEKTLKLIARRDEEAVCDLYQDDGISRRCSLEDGLHRLMTDREGRISQAGRDQLNLTAELY